MTALSLLWAYGRAAIRARVANDAGASVIEYAFLVSLVAAFCIGAITFIGAETGASLSSTASRMP